MKNDYIEKAMHCIGLGRRKPYVRHGKKFYRPYRNFYAAGIRDEDWNMMELAGYANHGEKNQCGRYIYRLTRNGLDWLGSELGIYIWDPPPISISERTGGEI